jgi:signal transduction histidine kinase/integral membrane sensor domain MASE1
MKTQQKILVLFAAFAAYIIAANLGFNLATMNKSASPVWPASGIGIIALLLLGPWASIAVFLGATFSNFRNGSPFEISSLIGIGNTLEAIAGYYTYNLLTAKTKEFGPFSKVISLLTVAIFPTTLSAIIGTLTLYSFNLANDNFLEVLITWWVGDTMGVLLILPLLHVLLEKDSDKFNIPDFSNVIVRIWIFSVIIFSFSIIFFTQAGVSYIFLLYPVLLLSVWTAGIRITFLVTFLICTLGLYITSKNIGPFSEGTINSNLIRFQFFAAALIITTLVLEYLVKIKEFKWSSGVLVGSWILTGFTFYSINSANQKEKNQKFIILTEKAQMEVQKSLDQYFRLLESGAGLMAASHNVSKEDWKQFIKVLNIKDKFPGLNGVGVIYNVDHKNLKSHASQFDLTIKKAPEDDEAGIDRNKQPHYIITYLEPEDKNKQAIGLDLSSEKKRRDAALKAITGDARSMTDTIKLVQDPQGRSSFLIFVPFYINKKHKGFIYSPVIFEQFITASIKEHFSNISLKIHSANQTTDDIAKLKTEPIYSSEHNTTFRAERTNKVFLAGNTYTFSWSKSKNFALNNNVLDSIVSFIGSMFSLFLAIGLASLRNTSKKANELAELKTRELKETQIQLVNAARLSSLGMMASGVAHEINNPLSIISGRARLITRLLETKNFDPEKLKEYGENIITTVERVTKIVKSMRLLARDGTNDPMVFVPLAHIINSTLDICREKIKNSNIEITVDPIPEAKIYCREVQIGQVFINLINNAFDAIESLDDKWIHIKFDLDSTKVKIQIIDSGHGIPKDVANKLMVPFFTTKEPGKGTGLGLSISRSILKEHAGSIEIDFNNKNTCFIVELPLKNSSIQVA